MRHIHPCRGEYGAIRGEIDPFKNRLKCLKIGFKVDFFVKSLIYNNRSIFDAQTFFYWVRANALLFNGILLPLCYRKIPADFYFEPLKGTKISQMPFFA